jgi:rod shape-determining protein MreD
VRLPLYVLAVGGGTLAQVAVDPAMGIGSVGPDVAVVIAVLLGLRRGPEVGALVGFALGLVQDVLSGGPLGVHALSKALVGFAAGDLPRWFLVSRPIVPVGLALLGTIADGLLRYGLLQLFHYPVPLHELLARVILPQAAYNAALATLIVIVPAVRLRA